MDRGPNLLQLRRTLLLGSVVEEALVGKSTPPTIKCVRVSIIVEEGGERGRGF